MTKTKAQQNYIPRDGQEGAGTGTRRGTMVGSRVLRICWSKTLSKYRTGTVYNFSRHQTDEKHSWLKEALPDKPAHAGRL